MPKAGKASDDIVNGTGGNNVIRPNFVDYQGDQVDGSDGINDVIHGYDGNDFIDGGLGDDLINGDTPTNFSGKAGKGGDFGKGYSGRDTLNGGEGSDSIFGMGGNDRILVDGIGEGYGDFVDGGTFGVVTGGKAGKAGKGPFEDEDNDVLDITGSTGEGIFASVETTRDWDGNGFDGTVTWSDADGTVLGSLDFENIEEIVGDFTPPPTNEAPDAVDDVATTIEDEPVTIDVLGNDSDPDGDPLTVVAASAPNGDVTINADGTLTYVPDSDFNGPDTITYTVRDPDGLTDTASVTVDVAPANEPPVANPDATETPADTPVIIDVLANDTNPSGGPLDITFAMAENGTVQINPDNTLTYTPNDDFVGEDIMTYVIVDQDGNMSFTESPITVTADENAGPIAVDDTGETLEDTPLLIDVLANDSDSDGDPLTVTTADAPNGTVAINPDGTLNYTPDADFNGTDTITYTITDPSGAEATATVTIEVDPVNDAPIAVDDGVLPVREDGPTPLEGLLVNDSDPDGDPLEIVSFTQPEFGSIVEAGGVLAYVPDGTYNGPVEFTYTIADPDGATSTATVQLEVLPANDAPLAVDDGVLPVREDGPTTLESLLSNDSDPDGDPLEIVSFTQPEFGSIVEAGGVLVYVPDGTYNGPVEFTYTIADPDGATSTATVQLEVLPSEDVPVANPDTGETLEDTPLVIDVLANDSDPDGDPLSVTTADAPNGTVAINADGTLEYTPDPDFNGIDTITYTITDPLGNEATSTATIEVDPVNDAPIAVDDGVLPVREGAPTTLNSILFNDTDPDGDPLEIVSFTQPEFGTIYRAGAGLAYLGNGTYNGPVDFTYTVADPDGATSTATVELFVLPNNDPPIANPDSAETDTDTSVVIDVLANDTDEEGDPLTVTVASADNGTVVINTDQTLTYTPDAGFEGEDTIDYTITDSTGLATEASSTVTVTVAGPTGGDDVVDGSEDGEVMDPGYSDGDGDQIDGSDGINDIIAGNAGDDTIIAGDGDDFIDGGTGDDVIQGGDGDDTIQGSTGNDDILGGDGSDTYVSEDVGHVVVYIDDDGNGDIAKYPEFEQDAINSVETFEAAEIEGEVDKISFTTAIGENDIADEIEGLSDEASGLFFPTDGGLVDFGPEHGYNLSDILSGTAPSDDLPAVGPVGEYFVNGGEEDGQIGNIAFENFENIFFTVEEDTSDTEEDDLMAALSNGETLDETMPTEEEFEDDQLLFV